MYKSRVDTDQTQTAIVFYSNSTCCRFIIYLVFVTIMCFLSVGMTIIVIHLYTNCCTANPHQIEQVQFELKTIGLRSMGLIVWVGTRQQLGP